MPIKKSVLTKEEIDLVLKVRALMNVLLLKDLAWGTLSVSSRSMAKELDKALIKLTPNIHPPNNMTRHIEDTLTKRFFEDFKRALQELVIRKSPSLRIADWRAKKFQYDIDYMIRYFPTAK